VPSDRLAAGCSRRRCAPPLIGSVSRDIEGRVKNSIVSELTRIENVEDLRVLYAVESGSRAWGFASTDSDWDVRFIYLRRPEWYLSIQPRRDVLELAAHGALDISGWDLRKALALFAKSNPPLLEWLRSPIVYREASSAVQALRELSAQYFSPRSCLHHYLHMAQGNYREYLCGDPVRTKKYFYVLRPILACRWVEAHQTMPPMEFASLLADQLPASLRPAVESLLDRKRAGEELSTGPRIPEINDFLDSEIARLDEGIDASALGSPPSWDVLDSLFRSTLGEVWDRG